jgi:hypothetical protein
MPTVHAGAVLVGSRAVVIRGPSGAGKSRLALRLIEAAALGCLPFARLVADDRTHMENVNGRLLVRAPDVLAGLLEVRGLGLRRFSYEALAVAGWVVDLAENAPRMPDAADSEVVLEGVTLPRFAFPACTDPLPVLLAALRPVGRQLAPESTPIVAAQHYRK